MRPLSKEIDAMANDFTNVNYREKIKKLTLFDAILFRKAFDLNIPAVGQRKVFVGKMGNKIKENTKLCYD